MSGFCNVIERGSVLRGLLLAVSLSLLPQTIIQAQETPCTALVHTARINAASGSSTADLAEIAKTRGSKEAIQFRCGVGPDALLDRRILSFGEPGIGQPGFSSRSRQRLSESLAAGTPVASTASGRTAKTASADSSIAWQIPDSVGKTPFVAEVFAGGQLLVAERRDESPQTLDAVAWPDTIRVDAANGNTLVQVFDYTTPISGGTIEWPIEVIEAPLPGDLTPVDPPVHQSQSVAFAASLTGLSFDFDPGYLPGGGSNPGGFPIQVHLALGAGADVNANLGGNFSLDGNRLCPADAAGSWGFDFGAEMRAEACFDVFIFDPICIDIPYIPNFDMRARAVGNFSNYLLGATSSISDGIDRRNLYDAPIGGLPSIAEAGFAVDGSLSVEGTFTGQSIAMSDGHTYTGEGECQDVDLPHTGYHQAASYNELATLCGVIHVYPAVYLEVLNGLYRWDLPILDIPWTVLCGPVDLNFNTSNLDFVGPPTPTPAPINPGRAHADFDDSGCTGIFDFLFLVDFWQTPYNGTVIGIDDFLALLDWWQIGPTCY